MYFEANKVIVVGGSAGMVRQVAIDIVDRGGTGSERTKRFWRAGRWLRTQ